MARSRRQTSAALPAVITNAGEHVEIQPRRSTRKRKQVYYGNSRLGDALVSPRLKVKKRKTAKKTKVTTTTRTTIAVSETIETQAISDVETSKREGAVGTEATTALGRGRDKQGPLAELKEEEQAEEMSMQNIEGKTTTTSAVSSETNTALAIEAPKFESPVNIDQASASALIGICAGSQNTPIQLNDSPPKEPTIMAKKKSRMMKTFNDEMAVDEYRGERRKKNWLGTPDGKYAARKARALSQPIRFVNRERCDTKDIPQEKYTIEGSMGINYTVVFGYVPKCTCPDYLFRGKPCKHIIYVVIKVLKVRDSDPLSYQEAYISTELHKIFNEAPSAPFIEVEDASDDPMRKPIAGECPICYMEFESDKEEVVYCKAACGNNVHTKCIKSWLKSQRKTYHKATCPYCRHDWVE